MKTDSLLKKYYQQLKVLRAFESTGAALSWDRETWMPIGASADRGEVLAVLAGFHHDLATDKKFVALVDELFEQRENLDPIARRSVTVVKKDLDKSVKLPKEFVEETQEITNASHHAWIEAKQTNNFALFQPHLEKVVENRKKYAALLDPSANAYDVLLDSYEEGLTTAYLQPLLAELEDGITELLPKVLKAQASRKDLVNPLDQHELDIVKLQTFIKDMLSQIGFDWSRGQMGSVEHPFEISISPNDVRLNTHYEKKQHSFTLTGMVHELGHGLYEQNGDPKYIEAGLHHGVSLGIHESQSRLLENFIGRSIEFWQYFLPQLQKHFSQLKSATPEQVSLALNKVSPSFIRTEADEVTYNLHIILRFELEQEIIHGRLAIKDLPESWRAKMKDLLGVEPTTDKEGVLQDVHWSWGDFGYFPTYTLGNLNAAQLWNRFTKAHPNWSVEVAQGNFTSYFHWFKEHVWQHGSFYTPQELMEKATGEKTKAEYLIQYLNKKYL